MCAYRGWKGGVTPRLPFPRTETALLANQANRPPHAIVKKRMSNRHDLIHVAGLGELRPATCDDERQVQYIHHTSLALGRMADGFIDYMCTMYIVVGI